MAQGNVVVPCGFPEPCGLAECLVESGILGPCGFRPLEPRSFFESGLGGFFESGLGGFFESGPLVDPCGFFESGLGGFFKSGLGGFFESGLGGFFEIGLVETGPLVDPCGLVESGTVEPRGLVLLVEGGFAKP